MKSGGHVHDLLTSGASACGLFVPFPSPQLVEIAGGVGYDFVIADTEHGAASSESVENMIRAADAADTDCVVRIPREAYADAQRAMDAGAAGILAPHVTTADQARALVAAAHFPPAGNRGYAGTARSGGYGMLGKPTLIERAAKMLVMAQIEDAEAIENLDEIAAVPGLDVMFIGPADLAMSVGMEGREYEDYLVEVIDRSNALAARHPSLSVGCFAGAGSTAATLLARGVGLVALSTTAIVVKGLGSERAQATADDGADAARGTQSPTARGSRAEEVRR